MVMINGYLNSLRHAEYSIQYTRRRVPLIPLQVSTPTRIPLPSLSCSLPCTYSCIIFTFTFLPSILLSHPPTMTLPTIPLLINNTSESPTKTFEVISPYTNKPCWTAAAATPQDAIRAVEAANTAFPSWSQTKPTVRRDILLKTADILEARLETCAEYMRTEMGADVGASQGFVVPLAIRMLREVASRITSICGSVPVVEMEGQSAIVYKEAMGVILGIVPWYVHVFAEFHTLYYTILYYTTIFESASHILIHTGTPPTSSASAQQHAPSQRATRPSSNPLNSPRAATMLLVRHS